MHVEAEGHSDDDEGDADDDDMDTYVDEPIEVGVHIVGLCVNGPSWGR